VASIRSIVTAPPIRIPPRYVAGLSHLAEMQDAEVKAIGDALETMPEQLTTVRLADEVRRSISRLEASEAVALIEALLSLYRLLPEDTPGVFELAGGVAASEDLTLSEDQRTALSQRLISLFALEPLAIAARAHEVTTEHPKVFHDARVFCDIRPVFGSDVADGVRAATVLASLKVEYHEDRGPVAGDFYGLDVADLVRLRDVIDRALAKAELLDGAIDKLQVPKWRYRGDGDAADS